MRKILRSLAGVIFFGLAVTTLAFAQDPIGATTLEASPQAPVDYVWVLVCGFLVMFMQAGFAMGETCFFLAKNPPKLIS